MTSPGVKVLMRFLDRLSRNQKLIKCNLLNEIFTLTSCSFRERLVFFCAVKSVSNWIVYSKQIINRGSKEGSLLWGCSRERLPFEKEGDAPSGSGIRKRDKGFGCYPRSGMWQNLGMDTWGIRKETIFGIADDRSLGWGVLYREKGVGMRDQVLLSRP